MACTQERTVLTEFIELYCQLPCLWDMRSDYYKDRNQKAEAWNLLTEKLIELEPKATVVAAKKKIEHYRTAYKREAKKVKESRRTALNAGGLYVPTLWYYHLLNSILCDDGEYENKDDEHGTREADPLGSDEEFQERERAKPRNNKTMRKSLNDPLLERKKQKFLQATRDRVREVDTRENIKQNTFMIYVQEQLQQVGTFQRHVAEKLISEVLFLAKTGNLTSDTKIETPPRPQFATNSSYSQIRSPQSIKESVSPPHVYQYIQPSPSHATSPQRVQITDSGLTEEQDREYTDQSALKELLVVKKQK